MTLSALTLAATDAFRPMPAAAAKPIRPPSHRNPRWAGVRAIIDGVLQALLVSPMDSVPRLRNYPY
jgi:hypothetical protein